MSLSSAANAAKLDKIRVRADTAKLAEQESKQRIAVTQESMEELRLDEKIVKEAKAAKVKADRRKAQALKDRMLKSTSKGVVVTPKEAEEKLKERKKKEDDKTAKLRKESILRQVEATRTQKLLDQLKPNPTSGQQGRLLCTLGQSQLPKTRTLPPWMMESATATSSTATAPSTSSE
jgi:hypothetical protein